MNAISQLAEMTLGVAREMVYGDIGIRRSRMSEVRQKHIDGAVRTLRIAGWLNASDYGRRRMQALSVVVKASDRLIAAQACETLLKSMCPGGEYRHFEKVNIDGELFHFPEAISALEAEVSVLRRFLALTDQEAAKKRILRRRADPDDDIPF